MESHRKGCGYQPLLAAMVSTPATIYDNKAEEARDHASTKIFYCNGDKKDVYKLLQQIPFVLDQRSIIELKDLKNRFKIIIGKDQINHDKIISRSVRRKPKS